MMNNNRKFQAAAANPVQTTSRAPNQNVAEELETKIRSIGWSDFQVFNFMNKNWVYCLLECELSLIIKNYTARLMYRRLYDKS